MSPYHPKSDVFTAVPAVRPPVPLLVAFAKLLAGFSADFADKLAPGFLFACVSLATFFFVASLGEFAASSESSFLSGVLLGFGDELLLGEDFGTGFRVGWGLSVGLGVAVGVAIGSSISLFANGAGGVSALSGELLSAGVGSGGDSDFS